MPPKGFKCINTLCYKYITKLPPSTPAPEVTTRADEALATKKGALVHSEHAHAQTDSHILMRLHFGAYYAHAHTHPHTHPHMHTFRAARLTAYGHVLAS
eukprot:4023849-Pleurochrysis_carterae.AAC.1